MRVCNFAGIIAFVLFTVAMYWIKRDKVARALSTLVITSFIVVFIRESFDRNCVVGSIEKYYEILETSTQTIGLFRPREITVVTYTDENGIVILLQSERDFPSETGKEYVARCRCSWGFLYDVEELYFKVL